MLVVERDTFEPKKEKCEKSSRGTDSVIKYHTHKHNRYIYIYKTKLMSVRLLLFAVFLLLFGFGTGCFVRFPFGGCDKRGLLLMKISHPRRC